jgi:hypothetical protein
MTALIPDYDAEPERFLSDTKWPHDDVHPYVAERFAAASLDLPLTLTMRGCLSTPPTARRDSLLEPGRGLEPLTCALRMRCSTG